MKKQARAKENDGSTTDPALNALKTGIARWAKNEGPNETAISGLFAVRYNAPTRPHPAMYEPCLCVAVQGAKRVLLGGEVFVYKPGTFLISSVHLPTVAQITKASPETPFLGLVLKLDPREITQLMVDGSLPPPRAQRADRGMVDGAMTTPLLTALQRLVDLLAEPKDVAILAPVIRKEIAYRLLTSEQGARLRQVALAGSHGHQIAQAIEWLKASYAKPLRVEELAERVHMSPSAFHHHFRVVTAMSPLQYQKWLRLSEARRLMLAENMNAGTAALEVGYESPSQFSREYRRLFEKPPLQDVAQLRRAAAAA